MANTTIWQLPPATREEVADVDSVIAGSVKGETKKFLLKDLRVVCKGEKGDTGDVGPQGPAGEQGEKGDQGPIGPQGAQGPRGPEGPQGPAGQQGAQGAPGVQGPEGKEGPMGPQGAQGPSGPAGPQGAQGPKGDAGPKGDRGDVGPPGPSGDSYLTVKKVPTDTVLDDEYAGSVVSIDKRGRNSLLYLGKAKDGAVIKIAPMIGSFYTDILPAPNENLYPNNESGNVALHGDGQVAEAIRVNNAWILSGNLVYHDLSYYVPMFYDIETLSPTSFICRVKFPKDNPPRDGSMQYQWRYREVGATEWIPHSSDNRIINNLEEGKLCVQSFGTAINLEKGKKYEFSILPDYNGAIKVWSPPMKLDGAPEIKVPVATVKSVAGKGSVWVEFTNLDPRFDVITCDVNTNNKDGAQMPASTYRLLQSSTFTNRGDGTGAALIGPIYQNFSEILFIMSWSMTGTYGTGWFKVSNTSIVVPASLAKPDDADFTIFSGLIKNLYRSAQMVMNQSVSDQYDTILSSVARSPDFKLDVKPDIRLLGNPAAFVADANGEYSLGSLSSEPSGASGKEYFMGGFFALRKKGTYDWTYVAGENDVRLVGWTKSVPVPALTATGIVDIDGKVAASFTSKAGDIDSKFFAGYQIQYKIDDGAWTGTKVDKLQDGKIELSIDAPGADKRVTMRARQLSTQNGASPWVEVSLVVTK